MPDQRYAQPKAASFKTFNSMHTVVVLKIKSKTSARHQCYTLKKNIYIYLTDGSRGWKWAVFGAEAVTESPSYFHFPFPLPTSTSLFHPTFPFSTSTSLHISTSHTYLYFPLPISASLSLPCSHFHFLLPHPPTLLSQLPKESTESAFKLLVDSLWTSGNYRKLEDEWLAG